MKKICTFFLMFLCVRAMGQNFVFNGIVYGVTSDVEQTVAVMNYSTLLSNAYSGSITIPQTVENNGTTYNVTALGESAFESCTGVTHLNLPSTVRSLGSYCFYNTNFTTLQLPDSLRSIGDHAFLYSRVGSLHLPASFEEYGESAFWARNLSNITVDTANPHYRSIGGWLYSKDSLTLCIVPDGVSGPASVPPYVRSLGDMAFGFCQSITSVSLPEGLCRIGSFAFNCCAAVNNIDVPSTVSSIGICPFSYCPQLTNLTIASGNAHYVMDGLMLYSTGYDTLVSCHKSGATVTLNPDVKVIGGFENNTWVRNIDIPAGVVELSDNCFNGCSLTTIVLPAHMKRIGSLAFGENKKLTSITMPETLLSMGEGAFSWCEKLTSVVIPDSLKVIPKEAFNSCPCLASVIWGNSVEEIGYAAFWAMAATDLVLPETLKKVDDLAFAACANNLRSVTFRGQTDTIGEAVFGNANLDYVCFKAAVPPAVTGNGPLFDIGRLDSIVIPCGSLDAWLADSYWGQFADKLVEDCNLGVEEVSDAKIEVYPNPATGKVQIQGLADENITIELFDMAGRPAATFRHTSTLDISHLPPAPYIVKIHTPTGPVQHMKLIKK